MNTKTKEEIATEKKRKPGGQPENTNAVKKTTAQNQTFKLYPAEIAMLKEAAKILGISQVAALRKAIRALWREAKETQP